MHWARRLQLAALSVILVGYSGHSHYSASHATERGLATALALAPLIEQPGFYGLMAATFGSSLHTGGLIATLRVYFADPR